MGSNNSTRRMDAINPVPELPAISGGSALVRTNYAKAEPRN